LLGGARSHSTFPDDQINSPATLGMPLFHLEMLGQLRMPGFQQGIVQREGAIVPPINRTGELNDRLRPSPIRVILSEWIADPCRITFSPALVSVNYSGSRLSPELEAR
jgi:hypothetical protein